MKKEFILQCDCGAKYKFQGSRENLDEYLSSQTWMCELGRHVELGTKGDYLTLIWEKDELSKNPEIEQKRKDEYTVSELQNKFGTMLDHIGFGMFKDKEGNIWDFRPGKNGERYYSIK